MDEVGYYYATLRDKIKEAYVHMFLSPDINNLKELYKYFKLNQRIVDIKDYNPDYSEIYSREILQKIANHETGWEKQVPEGVADMIKERGMFGYKDELKLKEFS